ncbi:MAG: lipopolysaccharide heptosyltransferase I [Pseudohongiella sp.]|nr:lipopolysaccharide heptosyltransferase I [Pseudohongiella sp.]MDP2128798.1 lipopolysaccharide heptosyltransferase I [Pseudohongiella sp.]
MRILIVKTSSLGDVVHTLPALTDAVKAIPGLRADWVVEEGFAEIPAWHPAVDRVIPVAIRRWRKQWWNTLRGGEIGRFVAELRHSEYDAVIDAQGLFKSAVMTRLARGKRAGLDKNSIKEPVASHFYQQKIAVPRAEHAVQRVRQLFSSVLAYQYDAQQVDYGLLSPVPESMAQSAPALMFLHGTTWASKHWPKQYWKDLALLASAAGYQVKLPWGNLAEQQRAEDIADGVAGAEVLHRMNLTELAQQLRQCDGVIAVDTGLGHLAAALNRPTVSIYGSTNPFLSGTFGQNQLQLKSDLACSPCMKRECEYRGQPLIDQTAAGESFEVTPACYRSSPPADVLAHLQRMIQQSGFTGLPQGSAQ